MVSPRDIVTGRAVLLSTVTAGLLSAAPASAQLAADRNAGTLKSDPVAEPLASVQDLTAQPEGQKLDCKTGPIIKQLGGTWWYVFSCSDEKSMIFVSDKRNPAFPFIFFALAKDDRYELRGEGTGEKDKAAPAFADLEAMTAEQLFAWVDEARNIPNAQ